jgi:hypothetical protein
MKHIYIKEITKITKNKADNRKQKRKCFLTSCAGHYEQAPLWLNSLLCYHQTQEIWNSPAEGGFGQSSVGLTACTSCALAGFL